MFSCALLLLSLFAHWGLSGSVSVSAALDEAYRTVVSVVAPGEQFLTGGSVRSLFNTLGNRVQCGEVSCEEVSFIRLLGGQVRARWQTPGAVERGRGPKAVAQETLQLLLNLIRLFVLTKLLYHINFGFIFKELMVFNNLNIWIHRLRGAYFVRMVPPKISKSQMS